MAYIEIDSDLLLLAAEGGDRNCQEAARRILEMTPQERRVLRQALSTLDEWMDAAALDSHQSKTIKEKTQ